MEPINKELFLEILAKYNAGKATEEEVAYLEAYYNLFEVKPGGDSDRESDMKALVKSRIDSRLDNPAKNRSLVWWRYAAAAVLLLSFGAGIYVALRKGNTPETQLTVKDHAPAGNKASLTLANGKVIILDDAAAGKIGEEGGTEIMNTAEGRIIYAGTHNNSKPGAANLKNTITTPKGGQYQLVLSDGTKVWLNAASSITYPAAFNPRERKVELQGEAYFEVAPNKEASFSVKTADQVVEVLGTHFNVYAYREEAVTTTTLLEGSIRLSTGTAKKVLKPGEQSRVRANSTEISLVRGVDAAGAVAWKNGVFSFENADLPAMMREISRWYDVEVVYSGPLPTEKFSGEIPRNSNLSDVCRILELNNLRLEISGRTLKVSAKQ